MAARSTTQGTPVKSCSSTRAGMKLISARVAAPAAIRTAIRYRRAHEAPVFHAQQVFEQDPNGERQLIDVADAAPLESVQPVDS